MDVDSIYFLSCSKIFLFFKVLVQTQPVYFLKYFLIFAKFQPHVSYRYVSLKKSAVIPVQQPRKFKYFRLLKYLHISLPRFIAIPNFITRLNCWKNATFITLCCSSLIACNLQIILFQDIPMLPIS